jgi:hypothetical protein
LSRCGRFAHHNSFINSHHRQSLFNMTAHLLKTKTALLNMMKTLPDVHIVEEADFVVWGRRFVDAAVSRVQLMGWI